MTKKFKMIKIWQEELRKAANPEKIKIFMSFFKTGKGEYGEGDKFIGLSVPENRRVAKKYFDGVVEEPGEILEIDTDLMPKIVKPTSPKRIMTESRIFKYSHRSINDHSFSIF